MTMTNRVAEIAEQMRAEASDPRQLDEYTVLRVEIAADPSHPVATADTMAEIRAILDARAVVLAELRPQ